MLWMRSLVSVMVPLLATPVPVLKLMVLLLILAVPDSLSMPAAPRPVTVETTAKWNRLHTHAYALLDHVPDDDPITFDLRYELAFWIGEAGNAKAAKGQFADLAAAQARVLGPDDVGTLKSTHGVAYWTKTMGQVSEARDIYAELLPLQIRTLGAAMGMR